MFLKATGGVAAAVALAGCSGGGGSNGSNGSGGGGGGTTGSGGGTSGGTASGGGTTGSGTTRNGTTGNGTTASGGGNTTASGGGATTAGGANTTVGGKTTGGGMTTTSAGGPMTTGGNTTSTTGASNESSAGASGNAAMVDVTLSDYKIKLSKTPSAGTVQFNIKNAAKQPHEFVVFKTKLSEDALPTKNDGNEVNEDAKSLHMIDEAEDIEGGSNTTLTVDLSPGHYVALCNLPAHYKLGMHTGFTVK